MKPGPAAGSISVVIPAFNAEDCLTECITALRACDADPVEIIVVDDASTDQSVALARTLGARVLTLERNSGPSRARNRGAREALGEILFFVDADVVVHEDALARVRSGLDAEPDVVAIFGSYDGHPRASGTLTCYRNLLHHFTHQRGKVEAATFWSGCGAIRRDVFLRMGGFDGRGFPRCIEDIELGYRLRSAGYAIRLDRQLLCTHLKRWTLPSMLRTDILCRAIPWARLNLERGIEPGDLNVRTSQRVSVMLVLVSVACLPLALFGAPFHLAAALCLAGTVLLNAPLFLFFLRARGAWFAVRCIPPHLLYFLYSGVSYLWVWISYRVGFAIRDGNSE